MSTASPFSLTIDGVSASLQVQRFRGRERLSEAWSFDVIVTVDAANSLEVTTLAQRALLTLGIGATERAFYGVVAAVRLREVHPTSPPRATYEVRVVPRLWLLRRRRRSRIFQNMRVPDVVTSILGETGISARWQLTRDYPMREYCTQYEETDYAFIRRILAEAGIAFYFPEGGPVDASALAAGSVVAAAGAVGSSIATSIGGSAVGAVVSDAASMAEPLVPGDTLIGADDASCYPSLGGDDAAALAASTAAALAPAVGDALGVGGGVTGAAIGAASAVAGAAIAGATGGGGPVIHLLQSDEANVDQQDKVTRFSVRNSVRSSAATFRDYDPDRPMVRLQSMSVSSAPFPLSPLEAAAAAAAAAENVATSAEAFVPGAASALSGAADAIAGADKLVNEVGSALGLEVPSEVYEHHSPFWFPKWTFANDEAPRMLRQLRRRASVARGEGGVLAFCPAHRFTLDGHPAAACDGGWVVLSVEHEGNAQPDGSGRARVYWNTFECAPDSMPYPPRRPRKTPKEVVLTATVVGPSGEDIYVDAKGQIKVQFHWDRDGKNDGRSSCWIRTMQSWAGAGWGHQFIPRVGMEVVVTFEGGDPDKPLVLGCVYNGTHPASFSLPAERTRSGIRTQTSPGGGGFNELSFDDAKAKEQIYLHAQRNFDEVVEMNHSLLVRADETLRVIGARVDRVERDLKQIVGGDLAREIQGNRVDVVTGNGDDRVAGARTTRVGGKDRSTIAGQADFEYDDDLTTHVLGNATTRVGTNDKKRSWVAHAEGSVALSSSDSTSVTSDKELVLAVGKSSIRITDGKIEISADAVTATGKGGGLGVSDDGLKLSSKDGSQLALDSQARMTAKDGGSMSLGAQVKADGKQILLNSPTQSTDAPPPPPDPPTTIELKDQDGAAVPNQRFLCILDDGSQTSGTTDKDGKATLDVKSGGKVTFPDVSMQGDDPTGDPEPYVVRQGDYLDKLAFVYGFDSDKVWSDPKNQAVKDKRKNPNLLLPGDVLSFPRAKRPGKPFQKGSSTPFTVQIPKTTIKITFVVADTPVANEPYRVEGAGAPQELTTDGSGVAQFDVPVHVREVVLVFPNKGGASYPVRVGDMDPVDEPSGARKRLQHLGFREPDDGTTSAAEEADRDRAAILAFQTANGLEATGELGGSGQDALVAAHGS
ncbi:MAG TPA: type VI secretion system tip protein TssI/VgrG [Byssovorax sp.]|jgi:type VI secretion system secreted protein VgrG